MKKYFNKKGLVASTIVGIMIIMVSFVVITAVITQTLSKGDDVAVENLCKSSIATRAATQINVEGFLYKTEARLSPPLCKTLDKKVKGDVSEISEEIAYLSSRCWWMFGEGRHEEILNTGDLEFLYGFVGTEAAENSCFMCYSVLIDEDKFDGEEKIDARELMTTFVEEDHRKIDGLKYIDYIQGINADGSTSTERGPGRVLLFTDIEPGKAYGINFVAKNKAADYSLWKAARQTVITGLGIVATGTLGTLTLACVTGGTAATFGVSTPVCVALGSATTSTALFVSASFLSQAADNLGGVFFDNAERDTSIIYIDTLEESQKHCYSGDLAGQ